MGVRVVLEAERVALGGEVTGAVEIDRAAYPDVAEVEVLLLHDMGELREVVADRASFPADDRSSFSFRLAVPYDGRPSRDVGVKSTWKVEARADVPWALDPRPVCEVQVDPLEVPNREAYLQLVAAGPGVDEAPKRWRPHRLVPWTLYWLFAQGLIATPVVLLVLPIYVGLFAGLLLLLGPFLLAARTRVRRFRLELPEEPRLLGEWVPVDLAFELLEPIRIRHCRVTFAGLEARAENEGGEGVGFTSSVQLLGPCVLAPESAREPVEVRARVWARVPPDGEPSWDSLAQPSNTTVAYGAEVTMWVTGWPNEVTSASVRVVGARLPVQDEPPEAHTLPGEGPGVKVIPAGDEVPFRVRENAFFETLWPWGITPILGVLLALFGVSQLPELDLTLVELDGPEQLSHAWVAVGAGVALALGGVGAFVWHCLGGAGRGAGPDEEADDAASAQGDGRTRLDVHGGAPTYVRLLMGLVLFLPFSAGLVLEVLRLLRASTVDLSDSVVVPLTLAVLMTGPVFLCVKGTRLDREAGTYRAYWGLSLPFMSWALRWWGPAGSLESVEGVSVRRTQMGSGNSSWVFAVGLDTEDGARVWLDCAKDHDRAKAKASEVRRFLGLTQSDRPTDHGR
jgi:hypothetical protein